MVLAFFKCSSDGCISIYDVCDGIIHCKETAQMRKIVIASSTLCVCVCV